MGGRRGGGGIVSARPHRQLSRLIGIQHLLASEVDNVRGKSVQLQNPFTNHDLPGFFAYPTRHRRE